MLGAHSRASAIAVGHPEKRKITGIISWQRIRGRPVGVLVNMVASHAMELVVIVLHFRGLCAC